MVDLCFFFFFFQAEDGIRDRDVTGVRRVLFRSPARSARTTSIRSKRSPPIGPVKSWNGWIDGWFVSAGSRRSEERRVGKECRCGWEEGRGGKKGQGWERGRW